MDAANLSMGSVGLILLWAGIGLLLLVLALRLAKGAWSAQSFDGPPAVGMWAMGISALGLMAAIAGIGLMVWGMR